MREPPPTWPQRLLRAIPPMSDGMWLCCFLFMAFMVGMAVAMAICTHQQEREVHRLSLQYQLDVLDKRLKVLESR
jgi:hypothetical protein